jgi:transcriptional regulator with GAF, ATPase, and Fis domain
VRESAETELHRAELALEVGDAEEARGALARATELAEGLDAEDLQAHIGLIRGRVHLATGGSDEAVRALERALDRAREVGQRALEAACEGFIAAAYRERGAHFVAERHSRQARELWERIAATLPTDLVDAFWRHPRRRHLEEPVVPTSKPASDPKTARYEQLLEVYRQISASVRIDGVLRSALDAAVELAGAERGFLILKTKNDAGEERLEVPIARNLDREMVGKSHLKFSRNIAEQVIETRKPILTVDALADERFRGHESVHAMRLRSIVSVPIISAEEVLGALYLDNRFERGSFIADELDVLVAFADQVAIALQNARLVSELKERTEQLERAQERVQALVRTQAEHIDRLSEGLRRQKPITEHLYDYSDIVGRGDAMAEVLSNLDRIIDTDLPVLIQGESGTGKELIARAIHLKGERKTGPFIAVDCTALPEHLLESELFGHVKGAFTGAETDRTGLLVEARGGTLFLDELGELPFGMQSKLLRVLEEQEVRPLGSADVISIDVRIVCATNRRLKEEVLTGRFREDLFFRVDVVEITLPPLRDRIEDIPALTDHLLGQLVERMSRPKPRVSHPARRKLARYGWPGNVRQLRNVLSRALVLAEDLIEAEDIQLDEELSTAPRRQPRSRRQFQEGEADKILGVLQANEWNVAAASRELGIARTTLYRKLHKYGLTDE